MQPGAAKRPLVVTIIHTNEGTGTLSVTVMVDGVLPDTITIRLETSYKSKGSSFHLFNVQTVTLQGLIGSHTQYIFSVPFQGAGKYKYWAFVFDAAGHPLGSARVDPREGTGG
jgi:hypothetical protein